MIRKINDHALPPLPDEYEDADKYEWEKTFAGAKTSIVGFGQKGYWLYAAAIIEVINSANTWI